MNYEELLSLLQDSVASKSKVVRLNNVEYEVNQPQMDKFNFVMGYLKRKVDELHGKMESVDLKPGEADGTVNASFILFNLKDRMDIASFSLMLHECSNVSIVSEGNGDILISCTVPDVFIPKQV